MTSLILNFSICFSNFSCCKNCFCFSACSILIIACSFLKNSLISLVLCFSSFISSLRVCSLNLVFNISSSFFFFCNAIFSILSFSIFSNFNLLVSSFFKILYFVIVSEILSKNAWIYFSKLKFILILIFGLNDNCILTNLEIKLSLLSFFTTAFFFIFLFCLNLFFTF